MGMENVYTNVPEYLITTIVVHCSFPLLQLNFNIFYYAFDSYNDIPKNLSSFQQKCVRHILKEIMTHCFLKLELV